MRTRFWHPRIRRVFFAPPCLDAAAESAFQGSILHRKLLGRLSRRCYLGDDWGNHPAPAMTKRVPKLGARVLTCVDPLPCELGLVAFSWGVSVCCRNLLLSVSFLPWIAFCKIHGQMNVHNIHNSCAVKTGVGSWDIACACRKNTWYIIILSSFSLLNIHLGGVKMGVFLLPIFRHSHILERKLRRSRNHGSPRRARLYPLRWVVISAEIHLFQNLWTSQGGFFGGFKNPISNKFFF